MFTPPSARSFLAAQLFGLRVIPIGYVAPTQSIDGISQAGEHLSLNIPFLRSLAFSRATGCEADGKACAPSISESSVYINLNRDRYRMNSASVKSENYYASGFNTVLYSYSLCIASGAEGVTASGVYTVPAGNPDEKALGGAVELILGAYRAECELEICDSSPSVEAGDEPSLSFHTLAKTTSGIPSKFVGKGTGIYYLEPLYREDRLPDFEDLKKMHCYIKSLIARGTVLSIHPTTDNIGETLEKMSECIRPEILLDVKSRYGGFILETTENIQGSLIGKTPTEPVEQVSNPPAFGAEASNFS